MIRMPAISPEQRAIIRMRYIARCQDATLHLHPDLCTRVLNDYGCNVVELEPTTDTKQGLIEANWPTPTSARCNYLGTMLPQLARRILTETAATDATQAAYALS